MAGISFIYDRNGRLGNEHPEPVGSIDPLDPRFRRVLLKDDVHHLSYTAYPEYPFETIDDADWTVHFEGRLYGEDATTKLKELAAYVFNDDAGLGKRIAAWLSSADGDFVALFLDKRTGQICILNDLFGRLPLYCYRTGEKLILSRDLRFVADRMDGVCFDRMAFAQSLWIGYLPGSRTLLQGVERLAPATWIRIKKEPASIQVASVHSFNFEFKAYRSWSLEENANRLAALFSESCVSRATPGLKNVISLSGGLDSRAVAACFQKNSIPCRAATFIDHQANFASDARIAEEIAKLFDMP